MKLEIKNGNENYIASVVEIQNIIPLENCDNIQATTIFGNNVIVSKDVKGGDVGIFFPVETQINSEFLSNNNLFDDPTLNKDTTKKGFISKKGRIKCLKLRGNKSEGFWIPISSIEGFNKCKASDFKVGDDFDTIDGVSFCQKYEITVKQSGGTGKKNEKKKEKRFARIIDTQFHFHIDTGHLGKNMHCINADDFITISQKLHGASGIASYIKCKRKLNTVEKFLTKFYKHIESTEYDYIYSSRKVIKNKYINVHQNEGYYGEDIWKTCAEELKPFLQKDMTMYFEIVGYTEGGRHLQKSYDYGCKQGEHKIFIYRITSVNEDGRVIEFSLPHIQMYCKQYGLNCVPIMYSGKAVDLYTQLCYKYKQLSDERFDRNTFLDLLTKEYLEKNCTKENFEVYCNSGAPDEGFVLRKDSLDIECWKHKSFAFKLKESKELDSGETNIEDNQEGEV